jgi:hypothetical protein
MHVIATILAVAAYRLEPTDQTAIIFDERAAGSPEAIREWFYPGNTMGVEFVYTRRPPDAPAETVELPDPPQLAPAELGLIEAPALALFNSRAPLPQAPPDSMGTN